MTSKGKEKPKETAPGTKKSKEHIVCFSCNQKGHYRSQCPKGKKVVKAQGGSSIRGGASKVKRKVTFIKPTPLNYGKKHDSSNLYHFNAIYHENRKHDVIQEKHVALHAKTTTPRVRKVDENLGKKTKDFSYRPRNKNAHGFNEKPKSKDLMV